jgi:hypothetical protein
MTLDEFTPITLWNLLDERASLLTANILDGYTDGFEKELADELISALTPAQRAAALEWLVHDKLQADYTDGFTLDECDEGSYKTAGAMAGILLAEIRRQEREPTALRTLATGEIWDRRLLTQWMRENA